MAGLRLFLFHTALGSGAAPLPPLTPVEDLEISPDGALAIRRGLAAARDELPGVDAPDAAGDLSFPFEGALVEPPLAARKVLFTETALKEAGFLTDDEFRP